MVNSKEVLQTIRQRKPPISIIGEPMQDIWYWGKAWEPSQQNPDVQKFVGDRKLRCCGGAANVRNNIAVLSGHVAHHMTSASVSERHRWWDSDKDAMVFRYDVNHEDTTSDWVSRIGQLRENVVIADYGQGMISWERVITLSKERPEKVIFSPHLRTCRIVPVATARNFDCWVWVMNWAEFNAAADSIKSQNPSVAIPDNLVVTNGNLGVSVNDDMIPVEWSRTQQPLHTVGIGDVFLAAFSCAHFSEIDLRESVEFAIAVCRSVLEKRRHGTCAFMEGDLA